MHRIHPDSRLPAMPGPIQLTRRQALKAAACGFGYLALAGLAAEAAASGTNPLAPKTPHFTPRAKRVIFLFMQGGVSHVDSFDYKPRLDKDDGKMLGFDDARIIANTGMRGSSQRVMKPLWKFAQHGQSGRWASDLFPEIEQARRRPVLHPLAAHRGRRARPGDAVPALRLDQLRPARRWARGSLYGLGTENENLPGFVSIAPSAGNGGPRNYGNAFLPAVYQGTAARQGRRPASEATIRNLANPSLSPAAQRRQFDLLRELNAEQLKAAPGDTELEAVVNSYELAWRMQNNAPDVLDLSKESAGDAGALRHRREGDRQLRPAVPDGPPAVRGGRALRAGDLRRQHRQPGLGPALEPAQARRPRPGRGQADRRPAGRPEAARPARRHARLVGRRVRPHALRARRTAPAATTTPAASPSGWPAAASSRASPTARPTSSATLRWRTRSTCTTCTRPSCTCSASTTKA